MCQNSGLYVIFRQDCGSARLVPVDCGDPLCPECERNRANERRRRWLPVLKSMRSPRLLTFTIRSGPLLVERIDVLQVSFRKWLDLRLGPRNRDTLGPAALEFAREHYGRLRDTGELTAGEYTERLEFWKHSLDRFWETTEKFYRRSGKWPRLRDVAGQGFASLEITETPAGWHPHRHVVLDGQFIPWPLLVAAWRRVTAGEGEIVDIRAIDKRNPKSVKEVVKYLSKAWEIAGDSRAEFRAAVRGLKRIWPLGGAKPVDPETVCPYCSKPGCSGRLLAQGEVLKRGVIGSGKAMVQILAIALLDGSGVMYFMQGEGRCWNEVSLDLIPRDFACHSQSTRGP